MTRLNCGCGRDVRPGWCNLDREPLPGVDVVFDLEECGLKPLPFPDDSVDEFLLSHIVEHIVHLLPVMQELWRVARSGAPMTIRCPYGSSDDAEEDPTHVRRMFIQSAFYFSQPAFWRVSTKEIDYGVLPVDLGRAGIPGRFTAASGEVWLNGYGYRGDWQAEKVTLVCDPEFAGWKQRELLRKVQRERNIVREMIVELRAVKPAREPLRELIRLPKIELAV